MATMTPQQFANALIVTYGIATTLQILTALSSQAMTGGFHPTIVGPIAGVAAAVWFSQNEVPAMPTAGRLAFILGATTIALQTAQVMSSGLAGNKWK